MPSMVTLYGKLKDHGLKVVAVSVDQSFDDLTGFVRDLNMPIDIVGCPIVREEDGLALSSRNAYLSPEDRAQAVSLSRALFAAQEQVAAGECSARALVGRIRERIEAAGPVQIDYIEVVDPESLEPVREVLGDARICLAARIGPCRLIDNIAVRHAR